MLLDFREKKNRDRLRSGTGNKVNEMNDLPSGIFEIIDTTQKAEELQQQVGN